jgi:hypothetical protein
MGLCIPMLPYSLWWGKRSYGVVFWLVGATAAAGIGGWALGMSGSGCGGGVDQNGWQWVAVGDEVMADMAVYLRFDGGGETT